MFVLVGAADVYVSQSFRLLLLLVTYAVDVFFLFIPSFLSFSAPNLDRPTLDRPSPNFDTCSMVIRIYKLGL